MLPTHPETQSGAASVRSRGIDATAPRVASATWALPQRIRAMVAAVKGSNSNCAANAGTAK